MKSKLMLVGVICWSLMNHLALANVNELLQKMSLAVKNLNYDGIFVYSHDQQIDTLRLIHGKDKKGEIHRLISLNGEIREVFRDASRVICQTSGNATVIHNAANGNIFPVLDDIPKIMQYYRIKTGEKSRIAGFDTQTIQLLPVDNFRYGYQIWLSLENNFPLRVDLINQHDHLEKTMFTSIAFLNEMPRQALRLNEEIIAERKLQEAREIITLFSGLWTIKSPPAGYVLKSHGLYNNGEHMVYSDGLAYVSIYIEKGLKNGLKGAYQVGAVNTFGLLQEGVQITAVGIVPQPVVRRLAQSAQLK